jgi:hypothetical protein
VAFDEDSAQRLRAALPGQTGVAEVKMFGCFCLMLNGHMLCGVGKPGFMFRVGKDRMEDALSHPGTRPMLVNGRPMGGMVWVDPAQCNAGRLGEWMSLALTFVSALPPKARKAKARRPRAAA